MSGPIVFLDKDGTLIADVPYNVDPAKVVLAEGATEGLPLLRDAGFRLAIVSNQSGVAHGYFPESALAAVEGRLRDLLSDIGVSLAGFYYCPHHPRGTVAPYARVCGCRKPLPGMILAAAKQLQAIPAECWMVGDILDEVEAGSRAGCRTVLIDYGNETEWRTGPHREPLFRASNLRLAAETIVSQR
jgi:histidinol-phosphate phosphatase family protein